MELTQLDMKKIKALHVTTKLPVYIIDKDNSLVTSYCSSYAHPLSYKLTEKKVPSRYVSFYYGILREVFLAVKYKDISIILGPYLTRRVSDKDLTAIFNTLSPQQQKTLEKMNYQSYYHSMPVYSLGDMRDFLILLGFLFDFDLEQEYSTELHRKVAENSLTLEEESLRKMRTDSFREERYLFHYENRILNLVEQGDLKVLKQEIANLGSSVTPVATSDSLRTEKNYTIIILEKLSSLAIQVGKDILRIVHLRDFYIRKLEQQTDLIGVLDTRDSAIIHFTKELHGLAKKLQSPLIRCIVQHINLKIYEPIKVATLAREFYISESALRRNFKNEMGMTNIDYITTRKVEEAKVLLQSGLPISDTAKRLSYYDMSHFHRAFKKHTGITPQQFKNENTIAKRPLYT